MAAGRGGQPEGRRRGGARLRRGGGGARGRAERGLAGGRGRRGFLPGWADGCGWGTSISYVSASGGRLGGRYRQEREEESESRGERGLPPAMGGGGEEGSRSAAGRGAGGRPAPRGRFAPAPSAFSPAPLRPPRAGPGRALVLRAELPLPSLPPGVERLLGGREAGRSVGRGLSEPGPAVGGAGTAGGGSGPEEACPVGRPRRGRSPCLPQPLRAAGPLRRSWGGQESLSGAGFSLAPFLPPSFPRRSWRWLQRAEPLLTARFQISLGGLPPPALPAASGRPPARPGGGRHVWAARPGLGVLPRRSAALLGLPLPSVRQEKRGAVFPESLSSSLSVSLPRLPYECCARRGDF